MGRGRESSEPLDHQGPWSVARPRPVSCIEMGFHREVESSETRKCLLGGKEYVCIDTWVGSERVMPLADCLCLFSLVEMKRNGNPRCPRQRDAMPPLPIPAQSLQPSDNSQNRSLFDIIRRSMLCKKRTQESGTREAGR